MLHIYRVDCDELTLQIINENSKQNNDIKLHIVE